MNALTAYIADLIHDCMENAYDAPWTLETLKALVDDQIAYERSATDDENSVEFIKGFDAIGVMDIQYDLLLHSA